MIVEIWMIDDGKTTFRIGANALDHIDYVFPPGFSLVVGNKVLIGFEFKPTVVDIKPGKDGG
jgi:hypothetical protein